MTYELMLVLKPDFSEEESQAKIEEIKKLITDGGGEVVKEEPWGKRALAYPISHFKEGIYHFLELKLDSSQIKDLEKTLSLRGDVLRFLVVCSN